MTEREVDEPDPWFMSQSAFVRGFIDDSHFFEEALHGVEASQSAFVRGFIDDPPRRRGRGCRDIVSIRVRARLHR